MCCGKIRNWAGKIHIRFAFLFTLIFLTSSLLLFSATLFTLFRALDDSDRDFIGSRLVGYWAYYQAAGRRGLEDQLRLESRVPASKRYLVRIEDASGKTVFSLIPVDWQNVSLDILEGTGPDSVERYLSVQIGRHLHLQLRGIELDDGDIVQIGVDMTWRENLVRRVRKDFLLILAFIVILCFLSGALVAARALRPLVFLNREIDTILETGDLNGRIPSLGSGDQLSELAGKYNTMMDRIESLVSGMRETLDNTAHDIRTPLTGLRGTAELALRRPDDAAGLRGALEECVEQSDRILLLVNTYLDITAAEYGLAGDARRNLQPGAVLDAVAEVYEFAFEEKGVRLEKQVRDTPPVLAEPGTLHQAFGNLLDNALKFSPAGSRVIAAVDWDAAAQLVVVSVRDEGPGIAAEEREKIWQRLYRGEKSRTSGGLGLGLSLVKAVVEGAGGTVEALSRGKGAEFLLRFPPVNITKL